MNQPAEESSCPLEESRPPAVGKETNIYNTEKQSSSVKCATFSNCNMATNETPQCSVSESLNNKKETSDKTSESSRTETDMKLDLSNSSSQSRAYRWARGLSYLLEDDEGVRLFQHFLQQERQDTTCLTFLFACRGFKITGKTMKWEERFNLARNLYNRMVKKINAINDETKQKTKHRISSKTNIDETIFDEAQQQVETYVSNTTYPNFLKSDMYIELVNPSGGEIAKDSPVLPSEPGCLPTLHEDSELQISGKSTEREKSRSAFQRTTPMYLSRIRPESGSYLASPYSSCHARYGSFLPTSAQDSELQSLSSDAQTDDAISMADSSVDYSLPRSKLKRQQRKGNVYMNDKDGLNLSNFIPMTQRLEDKKLKNTQEFHDELVKKLSKLIEEQKTKKALSEKLRDLESNETSLPAAQGFDANFFFQQTEDNDQDILDRHVSRVFDDSGQTPILSPICDSPGARNTFARPNVEPSEFPQDLSYTTTQKVGLVSPFSVLSAAKHKREHDTRSNDSGAITEWISNDNLAGGGSLTSKQTSMFNRMPKDQSRRSYKRGGCSINDSASSIVDSGISEICEPVMPSHSKVTHWLETKRGCSESEKDCRHSPSSPVLCTSSQKATYHSVEDSLHNFSLMQPRGSLLAQNYPQDLVMSAPDTTSNLIEARKKLEDDGRLRMNKGRHPSGAMRIRQSFRAADPVEDGISHRKQSKKSSPSMSESGANETTVIGYSYGQGSHVVPYLTRYHGKNVTLKNFKSLLTKKGNFKYYFKKVENAFGTGTVLEEVSDDHAILPLWEGKVFCVIETVDDT